MRDALAERLLATVMNWDPADVVEERPVLQALADLKYDAYQQYSPGMWFVESLALWLAQFETEERRIAYDFVKRRLVFFSHEEMSHFAAITYPDVVRPLLLDRAAIVEDIPRHHLSRILKSKTFSKLQRSSLFLGLSDGARIDLFRRSNQELSHEQIFQSYELASTKLTELSTGPSTSKEDPLVPAVVLLDDFSASGTSYFRREEGEFKGKIAKFLNLIGTDTTWRTLVRVPDTMVIVALYVATDDVIEGIRALASELLGSKGAAHFHIRAVQRLPRKIQITPASDEPITSLADKYYDDSMETEHTKKGGTDLKFGFAGGGLPVVLHHNTPNNSLFLLSAEDRAAVRALFPRVSRHRSET